MGRPRKRRRWEDDVARVEASLIDDFGALDGGVPQHDKVLQPLLPHESGGMSPTDELLMGSLLSNFPIHCLGLSQITTILGIYKACSMKAIA